MYRPNTRGNKSFASTDKQSKAREIKKAQKVAKARLDRGFRDWKNGIKRMIEEESRMEIREGNPLYVLPLGLVRLVWEAILYERIQLEAKMNGEEGAAERALEKLQAEAEIALETQVAKQKGHDPQTPEE